MAEFIYNNAKHASTDHILFELNCKYYFCILYKNVVNLRSKLKSADELATKLRNLRIIYKITSNILKSFKNNMLIKM